MKHGSVVASACLILIPLMYSAGATALIVFDNGGPDGFRGGWSDVDQGQELADDFVLNAANTMINGISWSGSYYSTNTPTAFDSFTFNFYTADLPALPFLSIDVGSNVTRVDSGIDQALFGLDIYNFAATFDQIAFAPDVTYYLSIVNNTAGADDDWLWEQSRSAGNAQFRSNPLEPWIRANSDFAFALELNSVPLPSSMALVILGLLPLFGARAHRRNNPSD
jgi:hypothetical protein